jgi:acyl-CoA dehydrogenase
MDFYFNKEQEMIAKSAKEIAKKYGPEYWYDHEENKKFPRELWKTLGEAGILGLGIPEEYGGSGMGLTEGVIAMEELCANGGGLAPAVCFLLGVVFGGASILSHGTEEQKNKYLPHIASGEMLTALGLTEPDAGTDTLSLSTFAESDGDIYLVNGNKIFISAFEDAGVMVLVTRTTRLEDSPRRSDGLTLLLVDLPNADIKHNSIPKHAINYVKTCELGFHDVGVPKNCILGEEGKGWYHVLQTLNPERIVAAIGAVGCAKAALSAATKYVGKREVFGRPIGANQGIQFPMAAAYAKVECARLAVYKAATLYDQNADPKLVGDIANMAKFAAVESAVEAIQCSMQAFGGYGFAKEYHLERWWREIQLVRVAPISQQMTMNYIAEHIMGLPKSY